MRGVQGKLCDTLRTRAIPAERLRGVFTTRRYTNPRLPYLTLPDRLGRKNPLPIGYPARRLRSLEPPSPLNRRLSQPCCLDPRLTLQLIKFAYCDHQPTQNAYI